MKAIIIEEERFDEVCEAMEVAVMKSAKDYPQHRPVNVDQATWENAMTQAHRTIHYVFVRWAQSHGVRFVR